jgi:hypothetical protein
MNLEGEATSSGPALRPGEQLASAVCSTRVIVVRVPAEGRPLITCGGQPMVPAAPAQPSPAGTADAATLIGNVTWTPPGRWRCSVPPPGWAS